MAVDAFSAITPNDGSAYPDTLAINATGPSATDGTPLTAISENNYKFGRQQALLDYAGLTPTGVAEAAGLSQEIEAIKLGFGVGPGWVRRRDIFDSPAVHGDRSIILAEQGVLIASYVDLDAATWIGGNTAAQVAAIAAGEYYYRSSDAAGLVGDAAGPYLQLPPNPVPMGLKQYTGTLAGADFTVSGGSINSVQLCNATPYQKTSGEWWLEYMFRGSRTGTTNNIDIAFSGVTFKASVNQAVCGSLDNGTPGVVAFVDGTLNQIRHDLSPAVDFVMSYGNVELNSKPTWADDFEPQYAITY